MLLGHHFQGGSFGQGGQTSGEHRSTGSAHPWLPDMPPSCSDGMS